MVVLGLFCIGAKHSLNYFRNHVQYFKPIFEGFINIKTTHHNKVYRKAEKAIYLHNWLQQIFCLVRLEDLGSIPYTQKFLNSNSQPN